MPALALTNQQLEIVLTMAQPLGPADRSHFLEAIAALVPVFGADDGGVALACCIAQRLCWRGPMATSQLAN
jgi:hypothetical protein